MEITDCFYAKWIYSIAMICSVEISFLFDEFCEFFFINSSLFDIPDFDFFEFSKVYLKGINFRKVKIFCEN